jgi:hypothetical protein
MQLPTINNNGTAPSDLLEQQLEAIKHVRRAIEAVEGTCPHGRDYVPQGPINHAGTPSKHPV